MALDLFGDLPDPRGPAERGQASYFSPALLVQLRIFPSQRETQGQNWQSSQRRDKAEAFPSSGDPNTPGPSLAPPAPGTVCRDTGPDGTPE